MILNEDHKALKKFERLLSAVRAATSPTIPIQLAHTFVICAANDVPGAELTVTDLAELASTTKGTMSRHLLDMSDNLRSGKEGYGLLKRRVAGSDLRNIAYALTPKGNLLKKQLIDILED